MRLGLDVITTVPIISMPIILKIIIPGKQEVLLRGNYFNKMNTNTIEQGCCQDSWGDRKFPIPGQLHHP